MSGSYLKIKCFQFVIIKVVDFSIHICQVMKMKIPVIDLTNIYSNHESSAGYLSSDNSENGQQEEEPNGPTLQLTLQKI